MSAERQYHPLEDLGPILPVVHKISLLGGLGGDQLREVLKHLKTVRYKAGELIFRQGDQPSHIYMIESGRVKLVVDIDATPLELAEYDTGQCFGETAAIGILPHSASALVTEDTELLVLPREALYALYHEDPKVFGLLILNIAREACRRLHKTDELLLHYAAPKHR